MSEFDGQLDSRICSCNGCFHAVLVVYLTVVVRATKKNNCVDQLSHHSRSADNALFFGMLVASGLKALYKFANATGCSE